MKERQDDYLKRREHLSHLSDEELKDYFYKLTDKIVDPLLELSFKNTTKSIERSVLLRMGLSSIEAKAVVDKLNEFNLLRKGAGHCLYKIMINMKLDCHQAASYITESNGINYLLEVFK
jgi:D-ornithine 4,5-aminomutase subunit alpha